MLEEQNNPWYYKFSYFFISNQVVLKRLAVVLLVLLNIAIWWNGGVKIGNYVTTFSQHKATLVGLTTDYIDWQSIHQKNKPKNLKIVSTDVIKSGDNKYDFVAMVNNPNENWKADKVNFAFNVDGYRIDNRIEFILPEQDKYLTSFSYKTNTPPTNVELKIDNVAWKRIENEDLDKKDILDNIIISNDDFNVSQNISQLSFRVFNNTHFNFWQTGWQIALYKNERLYAFNYVTLNTFLSGDRKDIIATWLEQIDSPSDIKIIPDVDIFDSSNFIINSERPTVNLIRGARTRR